MQEADTAEKTGERFVTSEVLYQLSYVGLTAILGGGP